MVGHMHRGHDNFGPSANNARQPGSDAAMPAVDVSGVGMGVVQGMSLVDYSNYDKPKPGSTVMLQTELDTNGGSIIKTIGRSETVSRDPFSLDRLPLIF